MRIDLVGVDLVRIDLVGVPLIIDVHVCCQAPLFTRILD